LNEEVFSLMKRWLSLFVFMIFAAVGIFAEEKSWTGQISDSICGSDHRAMMKEHTPKGEVPGQTRGSPRDMAHDCVLTCVKSGGAFVFVTGGKVYQIENQDFGMLPEHAGHTVRLTGELQADGKTIKISNVTMSEE
jgi:hypothetical protein